MSRMTTVSNQYNVMMGGRAGGRAGGQAGRQAGRQAVNLKPTTKHVPVIASR